VSQGATTRPSRICGRDEAHRGALLVGDDYCETCSVGSCIEHSCRVHALADLPPPIDQIGFWNRLNQWLAMPSSRRVKTHDRIPRAVRQIAFGVFVALLFVIGGLVQIAGMLP
jgi:hypothetical protein